MLIIGCDLHTRYQQIARRCSERAAERPLRRGNQGAQGGIDGLLATKDAERFLSAQADPSPLWKRSG